MAQRKPVTLEFRSNGKWIPLRDFDSDAEAEVYAESSKACADGYQIVKKSKTKRGKQR